MLNVKQGVFGLFGANNYLITDDEIGESVLVDCSSDSKSMREFIDGTKLKYILLTHGHFDHTDGVCGIAALTGAKVVLASADADMTDDTTRNVARFFTKEWHRYSVDIMVSDGDSLYLGDHEIKVIATPGHTPGSVCYISGSLLFTGDTIMVGGVGRTDFPGGNQDELIASLKKIMPMTEKCSVYPGHGEYIIR